MGEKDGHIVVMNRKNENMDSLDKLSPVSASIAIGDRKALKSLLALQGMAFTDWLRMTVGEYLEAHEARNPKLQGRWTTSAKAFTDNSELVDDEYLGDQNPGNPL